MNERDLLETYVRDGKLMSLSTVTAAMSPQACSVWYVAEFRPDKLYFISRHDRDHSRNIATNPAVAGAIVDIPLIELGQVVRGVSFIGHARQLPVAGIDAQIAAFVHRWPNADAAFAALPNGATRLFEIIITEWVLFDEQNFPTSPRQVIRV